MQTRFRLAATVAIVVSVATPAAARDTWRYLQDGNTRIFGAHDSDYTVVLTCKSDKIDFGLTLRGSESAPILDEQLAPGEVRLPISLMVAIDGSPADEYVGRTLYLSHTGTMANFDGKEIAYRLAGHLGAAASSVELAVVFEGNRLWKRVVGADGAIPSSRQWLSECDQHYKGS